MQACLNPVFCVLCVYLGKWWNKGQLWGEFYKHRHYHIAKSSLSGNSYNLLAPVFGFLFPITQKGLHSTTLCTH